MDDTQSINVAMWLMVVVQTMGAVDPPGGGPRKMPAPRAYVPIIVVYGILTVLADAGATRAAKALAWINVAAAVFLGPFGIRMSGFLNSIASQFTVQSVTPPAPTGGTHP